MYIHLHEHREICVMKKCLPVLAAILLLLAPAPIQAQEPVSLVPVLQADQPILVMPVPIAGYLKTQVATNHQGEHEITACDAWMDESGKLHIFFPMNPAYHLELHFTVEKGRFNTVLSWVPLQRARVENRIEHQNLSLEKPGYQAGDIIYGYIDLDFSTTWLDDKTTHNFSVKGPFSAVVRPPGFNPLADASIRSYNPVEAVHELGDSDGGMALSGILEQDEVLYFYSDSSYTSKTLLPQPETDAEPENGNKEPAGGKVADAVVKGAPEPVFMEGNLYVPPVADAHEGPVSEFSAQLFPVRLDFFRQVPPEAGTVFREMTWVLNPMSPDREQLTIWFRQSGEEWAHVGYRKWKWHTPPQADGSGKKNNRQKK